MIHNLIILNVFTDRFINRGMGVTGVSWPCGRRNSEKALEFDVSHCMIHLLATN